MKNDNLGEMFIIQKIFLLFSYLMVVEKRFVRFFFSIPRSVSISIGSFPTCQIPNIGKQCYRIGLQNEISLFDKIEFVLYGPPIFFFMKLKKEHLMGVMVANNMVVSIYFCSKQRYLVIAIFLNNHSKNCSLNIKSW